MLQYSLSKITILTLADKRFLERHTQWAQILPIGQAKANRMELFLA
jgi:hypothetical protein